MFIYLLKSDETGRYKIGKSKNPEKRIKTLQTGNPEKITLLHKVAVTANLASKIEISTHERYGYSRVLGEWFDLSLEDELSFVDFVNNTDKNMVYLQENGNDFL